MMTIGVFSERTGMPPKTLRYYEEIGLLTPSVRSDNGYRQYEEGQAETALLIGSLRQAGIAIADIRLFVAGGQTEREGLLVWFEQSVFKPYSIVRPDGSRPILLRSL